MAIDQMAAQLIAELERQFEVDPAAELPVAEMGLGQAFARNLDGEPGGPLLDHRQAAARTGDRGADRDRRHVVPRAHHEAAVAAVAIGGDRGDLADVADDAGEHDPLTMLLSSSFPPCRPAT